MPRKIIYLINPISGTRRKSSLQELITRRTREEGFEFSIHPTRADGDYRSLIPLIREEGVTDIVICGGDGTVSAVAAALAGVDVNVGIIPMGSGNGLAFAARIPARTELALDLVFKGRASWIDGFFINDQFSCMLCGIGFDAEVAHEFARQARRGLQTYVRVTFNRFFRAQPFPFRIVLPSANGGAATSFPVDAFFINIANGNQFGNNFTIAPKASLQDGLLDIVIVRKAGRFRMLLSVIRQVLGWNAVQHMPSGRGNTQVLYFQVPSLEIENPGNAPLHIDGDPKDTATTFRIRTVPKVIRLIQPV